ncbi:MAG: hypothetical protein AAGF76_00870 [Pseudomonadota bacterium]
MKKFSINMISNCNYKGSISLIAYVFHFIAIASLAACSAPIKSTHLPQPSYQFDAKLNPKKIQNCREIYWYKKDEERRIKMLGSQKSRNPRYFTALQHAISFTGHKVNLHTPDVSATYSQAHANLNKIKDILEEKCQ